MADEQEVTMAASIRTLEGVGPQAVEIFEAAGFRTIQHLREFNGDDRRLWAAIETRKSRPDQAHLPAAFWRRLLTRCINIVYRARCAEATDFVPHEYMCPLTLDWFYDPVVVASGASYSRHAIEEHLKESPYDPLTRKDLTGLPIYDNIALRHAVEQYRLHHQRFRVMS